MSACHLAVGAHFGYLDLRCKIRGREQGIKNDGWTESAQQLSLPTHMHFLLILGPDGL